MSKKKQNSLRIVCDKDDPSKLLHVYIDEKEVHGVKDYMVATNSYGSYAEIEFYPSEIKITMEEGRE